MDYVVTYKEGDSQLCSTFPWVKNGIKWKNCPTWVGERGGSNLTQSYECQSNLCVAVASSLIILSMCKTFLTLLHCGRVDPFVSVDEPSVDVLATFSNIVHPISLLT